MGFRLEMNALALTAAGTIFAPFGKENEGQFPQVLLVYYPERKQPKTPSGVKTAVPGISGMVRNLCSRAPVFGTGYSDTFGSGDYSAKDLFSELFKSTGQIDADNYRKASHEEKLAFLENYANDRGVKIRFMDYNSLAAEHGDVQGYRIGDVAKISVDYKGKEQSPAKIRAITMHEILHTEDEMETQVLAKKLAMRLGDYEALEELKKIDALYN